MLLYAAVTFIPSLLFDLILAYITSNKWYDRVDDVVVLGGLPFSSVAEKLLQEENVKAVISMNRDYELLVANGREHWKSKGIKFLQLPVTDLFSCPEPEKLKKGVEFINEYVQQSDDPFKQTESAPSVYVHCKVGRNRSATVVGCYLMQRYGWNPEKAVAYLKGQRPQVFLCRKQWDALYSYYDYLHGCEVVSTHL